MLKADGVTKRFGGLTAVNGVGLEVRKGEILGLIGPNGAGKTTFFNILTGIYKPDGGTISFDGRPIHALPSFRIARAGMMRTFQNIRLLKEESVLDNVKVGLFGKTGSGLWAAILGLRSAKREEEEVTARSLATIERVGLKGREREAAGSLSYGDQRRVEIARALASDPKLLLLDEPTAGMNAAEVQEMTDLIRAIRGKGTTIVLIEHNVAMVTGLCDRVAVLVHGEKIADGEPESVIAKPEVVEAYLGKPDEEVIAVAAHS
ncbi:ABC transporter ATP-binding protein [Paenibacillus flagellatus]|uniref:ABC transporter ATP-binding protein n=1 Tax=Paenibacillus flagellatus TaxID=2211139 RepID=A0A2V5K468_9BACL|nr:ABC transporter ATP-binding protein [Paenibacillus flagellatus]PYI54061.1 ABC transporter ATP-binding protein [Paenibacillus flagellatus]